MKRLYRVSSAARLLQACCQELVMLDSRLACSPVPHSTITGVLQVPVSHAGAAYPKRACGGRCSLGVPLLSLLMPCSATNPLTTSPCMTCLHFDNLQLNKDILLKMMPLHHIQDFGLAHSCMQAGTDTFPNQGQQFRSACQVSKSDTIQGNQFHVSTCPAAQGKGKLRMRRSPTEMQTSLHPPEESLMRCGPGLCLAQISAAAAQQPFWPPLPHRTTLLRPVGATYDHVERGLLYMVWPALQKIITYPLRHIAVRKDIMKTS